MFAQPFVQGQVKGYIKAPRHWPCAGNSPVTGEIPAQRASNAENVSIWWRHHMLFQATCDRIIRNLCELFSSISLYFLIFFSTLMLMDAIGNATGVNSKQNYLPQRWTMLSCEGIYLSNVNNSLATRSEIVLMWMSQNLINGKSTLVQSITVCCRAPNHNLSNVDQDLCWTK